MTIAFNKGFYNLKAIKKATKEFGELADFKIKEDNKNFKVSVENTDKEVKKIIGDEFSNYVLAEMKND